MRHFQIGTAIITACTTDKDREGGTERMDSILFYSCWTFPPAVTERNGPVLSVFASFLSSTRNPPERAWTACPGLSGKMDLFARLIYLPLLVSAAREHSPSRVSIRLVHCWTIGTQPYVYGVGVCVFLFIFPVFWFIFCCCSCPLSP